MKDGVHIVYCSRPGCGKEVGAQRWEHDKVVEQEWVEGTIVEEDKYYCCVQCHRNKDNFVTPEEVADE